MKSNKKNQPINGEGATRNNNKIKAAIIYKSKLQQQDADGQVVNEQDEDQLFVASCYASNVSIESWLIDSGCTNHINHDKELFKYMKPTRVTKVIIGHVGYTPAKGMRTIAIETQLGTKAISIVLYVPDLDQNLLSVDYSYTFAPVARIDTIRLLKTVSALRGRNVHQTDVKSSFLNGFLEETIYVEKPEGFVIDGKEDKGAVKSDCGSSENDAKRTSGYCFSVGSKIFSWSCKKQNIVDQSTVEAEFVAVAVAVHQAL
ncbi:uncharacterized protein LOC107001288 [Solanum pennellii]|uniref:Uncharacterized protein LOC107001288 n=1 Tax=Solanum pennellii TaxID=28526 RepID=A0ABM1FCG3_SOLPN|nr:uncharacterized protein LOC107001288 [Solanum pennellii]